MTAVERAAQPLQLSPDEEARCRAFARGKLWLGLAELAIEVVTLAGLTLTGASRALLHLLQAARIPPPLAVLAYLVAIGGIVWSVQLPCRYLDHYWWERRFHLARQSALAWLCEWIYGSVLYGLLCLVLLYPVALTLRWWPYLLLPWGALGAVIQRLYTEYLYYPLLRSFYPVRLLRRETFCLPGIGRVTLPVYEVTVSHRTARVGASIHLRGKRSAIYVTDTLIAAFDDDEERVAMAHEFGHLWDRLHLEQQTHAGIRQAARKAIWACLPLGSALLACLAIEAAAPYLGLGGAGDLAALPLTIALTLMLARLGLPLANAEARRDEVEADAFALRATSDPASYLSMLQKLRQMNLDEMTPGPLTQWLFGSHPPYPERALLALRSRPAPRRTRRGPHRHSGDPHGPR